MAKRFFALFNSILIVFLLSEITYGENRYYHISLCTADGPQEGASVALDEKSDMLLIVFHDGRGKTSDIYAELIGGDGKRVRKDISVYKGNGFQAWPSVHFDGKRGVYLSVWQENSPDGSSRIMGRIIDSSGRIKRGVKTILKSVYHLSSPRILALEGDEPVLIYYDGSPMGSGLKAMILTWNLNAKGKPFLITPYVSNGKRVAAALNQERGEFLIVWEDFRNGKDPDIFGRIISGEGRSLSFDIPVSKGPYTDDMPAVAYDPFKRVYLVVWQRVAGGDRYLDIIGRFISENGEAEGDEFIICGDEKDQAAPSVGFDYRRGDFLVVWEDALGGIYNIRGVWVRRDGKIDIEKTPFLSSPHIQASPVVIFSRRSKSGLLAWEEYINGDWDIMGLIMRGK